MNASWVYYALAATPARQLVKIGYSTALRQRLMSIQQDRLLIMPARQRPIVLAVEPGGYDLEQRRHDEFSSLHDHDEWFRYEGSLRRHVAMLEDCVEAALRPPHRPTIELADWDFALNPEAVPDF